MQVWSLAAIVRSSALWPHLGFAIFLRIFTSQVLRHTPTWPGVLLWVCSPPPLALPVGNSTTHLF